MKKILTVIFSAAASVAAAHKPNPAENLVQYVKSIIGTQRMGHVYPCATVLFKHGAAKPRNRYGQL